MKKIIPILFILLSLALLLFVSCVKEQPTETTAAGSVTGESTLAPSESTTAPGETQNDNPFSSDNEAEYKDSWG